MNIYTLDRNVRAVYIDTLHPNVPYISDTLPEIYGALVY